MNSIIVTDDTVYIDSMSIKGMPTIDTGGRGLIFTNNYVEVQPGEVTLFKKFCSNSTYETITNNIFAGPEPVAKKTLWGRLRGH